MTRSKAVDRQYQRILLGTTIGGEVGTFHVDFVIRNRSDNTRSLCLNGMVDTGASYTVVPAGMLDELGVERRKTRTFEIADGSRQDLDIGIVEMELSDDNKEVYVIFGSEGAPVLLGAMALEAFGLAADAKNRCLIPAQLTI